MRNSSFISLPLWSKQLVTVCGHVGLPAFGREQGKSQSRVQVLSLAGRSFHNVCFLKCDRNKDTTSPPRAWEALRQSSDTLLSELLAQHFSLLLFLVAVYRVPKCPSPAPLQQGALGCLSGPSSPVLCAPFGSRKAVKCSSGCLKEGC